MTRAQLVGVLADILCALARDDSLEGTISYSCPEAHEPDCDFLVTAAYRVGNATGQGGVCLIEAEGNNGHSGLRDAGDGGACHYDPMTQSNLGERAPDEEFHDYVERQFRLIHDVLRKGFRNMTGIAAGIEADVEQLAIVIPELADDLTTAHAELLNERAEKEAAIAAKTQDDAEKAKLEGEVAAIEVSEAKLAPLVKAASDLVTPPEKAPGDGGGPATEVKPRYVFGGADPATIDTTTYTVAAVRATAEGAAAAGFAEEQLPLYEFSGDVAGQPPTGAQEGRWTPYEGPTEAVPDSGGAAGSAAGAAGTGAGAAGTGAGGV